MKAFWICDLRCWIGPTTIAFLVVGVLAAPLAANAQQLAKVARIGVLTTGTPSTHGRVLDAFSQGLRELGYVEGRNMVVEHRWAEGKPDRLPDLAAEVVRLKVQVIMTGGIPAVRALKQATNTIPIVVAAAGDLVGTGLVDSLARPGGNVTGFTDISPELIGKRLELLKETIPRASRVAALWHPPTPGTAAQMQEMRRAARGLGLQLQSVEMRDPTQIPGAYAATAKEQADALLVVQDAFTLFHRKRLIEWAARSRLPAVYEAREFADDGGLISYGSLRVAAYRHAALVVDKILKGAKSADIPVEQPTRFELVINMKAAKVLGITFPPSILVRADQVIR